MERVEAEFDGRMIEVEFDIERPDAPRYEVELITRDGRMIEVRVDAVTGDVLSVGDDD